MPNTSLEAESNKIPIHSLTPYFLITFGLAWGILGFFIFLPEKSTEIFGALSGQHPLFYLAVYAPAVSAFIIILYKRGVKGFLRYLSRLGLWRTSPGWYAFLLLGIPLVFFAGAAVKGSLASWDWPFSSLGSLLAALFFMAVKGPVEEFGWRGFALPLLQRKLAPVWAGTLLGLIWGIWHLPAFLLSGTPQNAWSFTPFLAGTIALSVIVTAIFNSSRGSILLPAFFHFQMINPIWPDAQPYDNFLFIAVAVLCVWINRNSMFSKEKSIKTVIPPDGMSAKAEPSEKTEDRRRS